jgi:hypothetical protein
MRTPIATVISAHVEGERLQDKLGEIGVIFTLVGVNDLRFPTK